MERFPIRVRLGNEESLFSYLKRLCIRNHVSFLGLRKYISKQGKSIGKFNVIDIYPDSLIDFEKLSYLIGHTVEQILTHTFAPAIGQFVKEFSDRPGGYYRDSASLFENNKLRFCPLCLKERGIFNLLWRVKDITICDIHYVNLVAICGKCQQKQQVAVSELDYVRCQKCGEKLHQQLTSPCCSGVIPLQKKIYDNWRYFLNSNNPAPNQISGVSKEQTLAILMLYLSQKKPNVFNKYDPIHVLTRDHMKFLLSIVRGKSQNRHLTMQRFMNLLKKGDFLISDFVHTHVPESFINSIFSAERNIPEFGVCLAPWCPSFNSNKRMEEISINKFTARNKRYSIRAGCLDCYIEYGRRHDGIWESVDGFVDKVNQIRQYLHIGKMPKEISV